jgi:hypothetical protein
VNASKQEFSAAPGETLRDCGTAIMCYGEIYVAIFQKL